MTSFRRLNAEPDANFRVYYRAQLGGALYCWQRESPQGRWDFFRCSQDGEPSHRVTLANQPPAPGR